MGNPTMPTFEDILNQALTATDAQKLRQHLATELRSTDRQRRSATAYLTADRWVRSEPSANAPLGQG